MKLVRPSPPAPPPAPAPIDIAGALAALFPGIDLDRDVELRDDGAGVFIVAWRRAEPRPTEEDLRAVIIPGPNLALTARQARLWLLSVGISTDAVRRKIAEIEDETERAAARIEWEYSVEIHINHPLVKAIGAALGFDAAQLRAGFEAAMTL